MSSDIVTMRHKDSDYPVRVLPSQVDNMKYNGWTVEASAAPPKKQRAAKPTAPIETDDNDEVKENG